MGRKSGAAFLEIVLGQMSLYLRTLVHILLQVTDLLDLVKD